jgi:hypothetical protein
LSCAQLTKIESILTDALSEEEINEVGRETGQSQRLRLITPYRLFLSIVAALGGARIETLADLRRDFNYRHGVHVAYKPFYNRLAQAGFSAFMRQMFRRLVGELALRILQPEAGSAVSAFEDIVIQDGSSFALKDILRNAFPGRFTTTDPAAIELHATYSGFRDNVSVVTLAPDKEAERQFLPEPKELCGKLLLADRGYPSTEYFHEVHKAGGAFIVRLTRSYDPYVVAAHAAGRRHPLQRRVRLGQYLSQRQNSAHDLDVEFPRPGGRIISMRVVVFPGKERSMTRLATNLARERFALKLVGTLYRFRWQVELCFKEWKSYANLHRYDTGNKHIAEGLAWASLCAAIIKRFLAHAAQLIADGAPISTRRVAMCAARIVDAIFAALIEGGLRTALVACFRYLVQNAARAHPKRDSRSGRLHIGLGLVPTVRRS